MSRQSLSDSKQKKTWKKPSLHLVEVSVTREGNCTDTDEDSIPDPSVGKGAYHPSV